MKSIATILLCILASTAHATRYVGTTASLGEPARTVIKGRWHGRDFVGRYKCRGDAAQCPTRRARLTLRAQPAEGLAGPPNGTALGTLTRGVLECEAGGLLDETDVPAWSEPRNAPFLRLVISCPSDAREGAWEVFTERVR